MNEWLPTAYVILRSAAMLFLAGWGVWYFYRLVTRNNDDEDLW